MKPSAAALVKTELTPRQRIVAGAVELIRERGVTGAALRDVIDRAKAPRGSLQHYFPGGKDQLIEEAIASAAEWAAVRVSTLAADARVVRTPGDLFAAMCRDWVIALSRDDYARGCPLLAATADVAAEHPVLRAALDAGFAGWQAPVARALRRLDVPRARADALAVLMISAMEGAIVLSRARRDTAPLTTVARELRPLLDGARRQRSSSARRTGPP